MGTSAIYAYNSTLSIGKNKIQNCPGTGVVAYNQSTIYFGVTGATSNQSSGNNAITENNLGIFIGDWSLMDLAGTSCKYNNISISSNGDGAIMTVGIFNNYLTLKHSDTYWGQPGLSAFAIEPTSSMISYGPSLTSPPGLPFLSTSVIEEDNNIVVAPELKKMVLSNAVSSDININELLRKARELQFNDNYNEALDIYKSILSFTNDTFYVCQSLTGIRFVYGATQDKEILNYVKEYSKGEKPPHVKIAYANMLVINNNFDEAILEYEKVAKNNTNTRCEVVSLVSQAHIYYFWKHDEKKVNEIIDYLEKVAPDDISFQNVKSLVARGRTIEGSSNEYFSNEEGIQGTEVKMTGYSLGNYPNPFNPTTTIQYTIPKDEFLKLTVYDITGRVVKELVNGYKSAGKYSVEFNASSYSSGTYYYKLEAREYKSMQKIMLVK